MDTKLTLNVDKNVIEQAKEYAKNHQISLSRLIESYLSSLVAKNDRKIEITPLVESLSGIIELENDFNYKESYTDYLVSVHRVDDFPGFSLPEDFFRIFIFYYLQ